MRARAYGVLFVAQLAIGSAALLARAGLAAGLSAPALSAWRLAVAAALLALVPAARAGAPPLPLRTRGRLVLAGCCLAAHFASWFASLGRIPVARSTLLVTTSPLFSGLAGRFLLGARLGGRFWAGLAVGLAGAVIVMGGPSSLGGGESAGDALALTGAALMAAYLLLVEDLQPALGTRRVVGWTTASAALAIALPVAWREGAGALPASAAAWRSIVGMALIPQLVGHTALNWSLHHFPAGVVGAATLLEPVFAAALAWWLLGETLTGAQVAGAAVLLAGVGLALTGAPSPAPSPGLTKVDQTAGPGAGSARPPPSGV